MRITGCGRPVSARQQVGDAAGGVAAGAGLGAVGVADAHEGIGVGAGGGGSMTMNWSQPMPVRRSAMAAARGGREAERAGALVEHDEVVAAAVHLDERDAHGG